MPQRAQLGLQTIAKQSHGFLNANGLRYSHLVQRFWLRHDGIMKRIASLLGAFAIATIGISAPAVAHEQAAGNVLSLREIERRVLPQMRDSEYLRPVYDATARAYRLKFIKDGRVTYVDVDARTGRIIRRSN